MSLKTYKINSNLAEYTDAEFSAIETLIAQVGIFDTTGTDQDFEVTESTPNAMTVDVNTGSVLIEYTKSAVTWKVVASSNAVETLSISANSTGSNRVDAIVVHLKQDEPNALKNNVAELKVILGTSAVALTNSAIDTSLGDGNWYRLADVVVPNLATTITNAQITSTRSRITLDALPTDGDTQYVTSSGIQTIYGDKTFVDLAHFYSLPTVTSGTLPTQQYELTPKKYIDDEIIASQGYSGYTGEVISGSVTPQACFVNKYTDDFVNTNNVAVNGSRSLNGANEVLLTLTQPVDTVLNSITVLILHTTVVAAQISADIYLADVSHEPTGSILLTQNSPSFANSSVFQKVTITFSSPLTLSAGVEYCIVLQGAHTMTIAKGAGSAAGLSKYSTDSGVTWNAETGSYMAALSYGNYLDTGSIYKSDTIYSYGIKKGFTGFLTVDAASGVEVGLQVEGVVPGFTGLTADTDYYLSTNGAISTSGDYKVGHAISTTELLIDNEESNKVINTRSSLGISQNAPGMYVIPYYARKTVLSTQHYNSPTYDTVSDEMVLTREGKTSATSHLRTSNTSYSVVTAEHDGYLYLQDANATGTGSSTTETWDMLN